MNVRETKKSSRDRTLPHRMELVEHYRRCGTNRVRLVPDMFQETTPAYYRLLPICVSVKTVFGIRKMFIKYPK
jgi:hypothetical protein